MKRIAVFAGTFDPITIGHAHVVRRAATLFDEIVVLVCNNSTKQTLFTAEERLKLAEAAFADMDSVRVTLCENKTVADAAREVGATAIVRGLRNTADYTVESQFAGAMRALGAPEVVFLDVHKEYADVSSTFVRELFYYHKNFSAYLPEGAYALAKELWAEKCARR